MSDFNKFLKVVDARLSVVKLVFTGAGGNVAEQHMLLPIRHMGQIRLLRLAAGATLCPTADFISERDT